MLGRRGLGAGCIALIAAVIATPGSASAHEGPPFPILMEEPLGEYVISVYADPDIGDAKFFIIVDSAAGGPPRVAPQVSLWVEPVSGRLPRAAYEAKQQTLRNQMQFEAAPHFDQRDMWNVGFHVEPPGGETLELTTQIESTPPGYGPWDLVIYLFPFVLLGGLWLAAMVRRSRMRRSMEETRASNSPSLTRRATNADEARGDPGALETWHHA